MWKGAWRRARGLLGRGFLSLKRDRERDGASSPLKMMVRTVQAMLGETSFGWIWSRRCQNTERRNPSPWWPYWTADCIVLGLPSSELLVLWDNTVPYCVSQCGLGFCHLQPKAFWVIYLLCPKQIHVRWLWFYSDKIRSSSLPCLLAS